jgi:alpha-beta hydrolase superfamily lysophospholipase
MRAVCWILMVGLLGGCAMAPLGDPHASAGIAAPAAPALAAHRLIVADGTALPLRQWLPAGEPRAVVLALHGFNDYSNAFAAPGAAWARAGIATYAYDQRGFGGAPDRGHWAGAAQLAGDVGAAAALLRRRHPGVPLYLLGESMGGAVALLAATGRAGAPAPAIDGVILVAPAVWGRQTMSLFERVGVWLADLMPSMTLSPDLLPVTYQASDNLAMLRAFSADPLVLKVARAEAISGLVDLMSAALTAGRRFDAPALILYGAHDEIVPREPMARFVDGLPARAAPRQTVAFYPRGYHMLLRDLGGALPTADIAAWIGDHAAALPSRADHDARARLTGRATPRAVAAR